MRKLSQKELLCSEAWSDVIRATAAASKEAFARFAPELDQPLRRVVEPFAKTREAFRKNRPLSFLKDTLRKNKSIQFVKLIKIQKKQADRSKPWYRRIIGPKSITLITFQATVYLKGKRNAPIRGYRPYGANSSNKLTSYDSPTVFDRQEPVPTANLFASVDNTKNNKYLIYEDTIDPLGFDKDEKGRYKPINPEGAQVDLIARVLKSAGLPDTVVEPRPLKKNKAGQSEYDVSLTTIIAKNTGAFLQRVREACPNIKFTYVGYSRLGVVDIKRKEQGVDDESEEELSPEEVKFLKSRSTAGLEEYLPTIGCDVLEKILRGLAKVRVGHRIKFPGDEGYEEEPPPVTPEPPPVTPEPPPVTPEPPPVTPEPPPAKFSKVLIAEIFRTKEGLSLGDIYDAKTNESYTSYVDLYGGRSLGSSGGGTTKKIKRDTWQKLTRGKGTTQKEMIDFVLVSLPHVYDEEADIKKDAYLMAAINSRDWNRVHTALKAYNLVESDEQFSSSLSQLELINELKKLQC